MEAKVKWANIIKNSHNIILRIKTVRNDERCYNDLPQTFIQLFLDIYVFHIMLRKFFLNALNKYYFTSKFKNAF